jgi:ribosomal protein S18 acetylase RimI-like enzyme
MHYRTATADDAEGIAQLHANSWRRTYRGSFPDAFLDGDLLGNRRAVWCERLGRPSDNQFVGVAMDGVQAVGFICAYGAQDPKWGSFIDNLHVSYDHQHRGIGLSLMRSAGLWLVSSYEHCGVYLWVLEANRVARRFYERLGGANAGITQMENPGGSTAPSCRYVWPSPRRLARLPK